VHSPEAKTLNAISLDPAPFTDDMVHESARHALTQRRKYARRLDSEDELVVANAMLLIIDRCLNMLKSQIEAQGAAFEETGGFSERLTTKRLEAREKQRESPPAAECPQCQKPMRRRKSAKGDFWDCSGFPECKGTREV
jgi:four helix bundle suffix protein